SGQQQLHLPALPAQHHALRQDLRLHAGSVAGRLPEGHPDWPEHSAGPGRRGEDLEVLQAVRAGPAQQHRPTPQPQPAPPPSTVSNFAYGYQVHMWDLNNTAKGYVVGNVQQSGFNWAKHQVEWTAVETAPGQYNWGELDLIVDMLSQGGIKVMLSVAH